ncbi:hypothetical protein F5Y16DRAFT_271003 [Xylariaceae sp. FL0255]|nr:hypothetical protein F5Y16DRAFT_271003 [Xylariaceae sp. FL0255]
MDGTLSQNAASVEAASLSAHSPSPSWIHPVPATRANAAPPSPISPALSVSYVDGASTSTTAVHSARSSNASSWHDSYHTTQQAEGADENADWEHDSTDDDRTVPKTEPMEDDNFRLDDVEEAPRSPILIPETAPQSAIPPKVKRPRGRPRKHPLTPQVSANKAAKGRSKTGCITCRKRKKKCDEAKPRCLNCEKNAVVCEGYHEKTLWKSGREKAEEERQRKQSLPHITLQPIFQGVETTEDRIFFSHYIAHLSGVLTVEGQHKNAFKDMLLQMAVEHRALMHSILSLASKHIDFETPYGNKLLSNYPKVTLETLMTRSEFHHESAMKQLLAWGARDEGAPEQKANLAPRYGQMLCLLLQTAAEGNSAGAHRVHLQAYKHLISENPPPDKAFVTFITEFFQYRVFADELIWLPNDQQSKRLATEDWEPWESIEPARLIGVGDGLFHYIAKITTIRNIIRNNMRNGVDPVVDSFSVWRAAEIEAEIRDWAPVWPAGDNRDRVSLLYKQMMWVYLFLTVHPPPTSSTPPRYGSIAHAMTETTASTVNSNTREGPGNGSGNGALPLSPASPIHNSTGHSPQLPPPLPLSLSDRRISIGNHHARSSLNADASPPQTPVRYTPQHEAKITLAVDESLAILDSFKPSDPVQTLLLVPCFVIGCASFTPAHQSRVRVAVRTVRGYTGLRNCDRVADVLEEVWRLMARGEWARVWDWQSVARDMGLDFSCA